MFALKIDPWQFTYQAQMQADVLSTDLFSRLRHSVDTLNAPIDVCLQGEINDAEHAIIRGSISTTVTCICQRCLSPFDLALDISCEWCLTRDQTEEQHLDDLYDTVIVVTEPQLALLDLIEDELLLALPMIPKHIDEKQCDTQYLAAHQAIDRPNPFSQLAVLLKKN